jgi:UDP-N-acetyl-D-mannosaminuronic acid transferase (WecB/TagA/CpsF family)
MNEAFPKLRVAGTHHGYFMQDDEEALVKKSIGQVRIFYALP